MMDRETEALAKWAYDLDQSDDTHEMRCDGMEEGRRWKIPWDKASPELRQRFIRDARTTEKQMAKPQVDPEEARHINRGRRAAYKKAARILEAMAEEQAAEAEKHTLCEDKSFAEGAATVLNVAAGKMKKLAERTQNAQRQEDRAADRRAQRIGGGDDADRGD